MYNLIGGTHFEHADGSNCELIHTLLLY